VYALANKKYNDLGENPENRYTKDKLLLNKNEIERDIASTLISLCSLYSSMEKHKIALAYVLRSNNLLETLFFALI